MTTDLNDCAELKATADGCLKLQAWQDAGCPVPTERDIVLRFRFQGSSRTLKLLRRSLTSGTISSPATWYLLEHVAVVCLGLDAVGLCLPAPQPAVERQIFLWDAFGPQEVTSLFRHELAHCWLLPRPLRDLTAEEEAIVTSPDMWRLAAVHGLTEEFVARDRLAEVQACALARRWGATGRSADAAYCTRNTELRARDETE